jgi:hypothetical protein
MRSVKRSALIGGLLVVILYLLGQTGAVRAGFAGDALIVVKPASPAALDFDVTGLAILTVTVLNDSGRAVTPKAVMFDAKTGLTIASDGSKSPGPYSATAEVDDIGARSLGEVTVSVHRASDGGAGGLDGLLVISSPKLRSATLEVTAAEAGADLSMAHTVPTSATIIATRLLPSFFGAQDSWVYFPPAFVSNPRYASAPGFPFLIDGVAADKIVAEPWTYLSSDRGGRLRVSLLRPAEASPQPDWLMRLGPVDGAGKYAGKLSLDASVEKAPTIDLTVNVQDFILWPILALVGGIYLAYRMTKSRDTGRTQRSLVYQLARIGNSYAAARKGVCEGVRDGRWLALTFHLNDKGEVEFDASRKTTADELYAKIRTLNDVGEVATIEQSLRDLEELVGLWEQMCAAAQGLESRVRSHRKLDPEAAVFKVARELLDRTSRFTKPNETVDFVKSLNDQSAAIEILVKARTLYDKASELWSRLTPAEQSANAKLNAEDFWSSSVRHLATKDELVSDSILQDLAEINRDLLAVIRQRPPQDADRGFFSYRLPAIASQVDEYNAKAEEDSVLSMLPSVERRPAAALLAEIRTLDRWEFAITGVVTSLVFLQAIYVDKNFGTGWNYLSAFLAALVGTLVINWKLLPWYRDYRLPKAA